MEAAAGATSLLFLALIAACAGFFGLAMLITLGLTVYQTIQRKGRWGINFDKPDCPRCGAPTPTFRKPENFRQAMWGGWTCQECGTEIDKWGNVLVEGPGV